MTDRTSYCMRIVMMNIARVILGLIVNSQRFDTLMLWIILGVSLGAQLIIIILLFVKRSNQ